MIRYELPRTEDLIRLGRPRPNGLSIYLPTAPTPAGRDLAFATAKSAVDEAVRKLRDTGRSPAIQEALRGQWTAVAADDRIWSNLAASLVIFLAPDFAATATLISVQNHHRSYTRGRRSGACTLASSPGVRCSSRADASTSGRRVKAW